MCKLSCNVLQKLINVSIFLFRLVTGNSSPRIQTSEVNGTHHLRPHLFDGSVAVRKVSPLCNCGDFEVCGGACFAATELGFSWHPTESAWGLRGEEQLLLRWQKHQSRPQLEESKRADLLLRSTKTLVSDSLSIF